MMNMHNSNLKIIVKFVDDLLSKDECIEIICSYGEVLLKVLSDNGIFLDSACGGKGRCGKCKITVLEGNNKLPTEVELKFLSETELKNGVRLACSVFVENNMVISLDNVYYRFNGNRHYNIVSTAHKLRNDVSKDPVVKKILVKLQKPDLNDQCDDYTRLCEKLGIGNIAYSVELMRKLPYVLRTNDYEVSVVMYENEIISVQDANSYKDYKKHGWGVAVDLGTTTIVCYLVSLLDCEIVDVVTELNSQRVFGSDVISRITYAYDNRKGIGELKRAVVQQLNNMMLFIAEKNDISNEDIHCVFVSGNTTMIHNLLGLYPVNIAVSPFIPVNTGKCILSANEVGFEFNKLCKSFILPCVSSYIGADIIAGMLACNIINKEELVLFIDLGTNGEIVLGNKEKIICCSVAAGPAFEGTGIRNGTGAVEGAINSVYFEYENVKYTTIGNRNPVGICGSGIVDAVSLLLSIGIIDYTGAFLYDEYGNFEDLKASESSAFAKNKKISERIIEVDEVPAFVIEKGENTSIGEPIVITQKDIREIQLAKAAVAAGIKILVDKLDRRVDEIDKVYLAGGFGNNIRTESAVKIGIIPKCLEHKVMSLGNTAGYGTVLAMTSKKLWAECDEIKNKMQYIELSTNEEFMRLYIDMMNFD